jgi:hypothetical protein
MISPEAVKVFSMLPSSAIDVVISELFKEVISPERKNHKLINNSSIMARMINILFLRFAFISNAGIAVSM